MYQPAIRNLIFDLGGVILNLHTDRTHEAFGQLAGMSASDVRNSLSGSAFFNDYEKGLLTDAEFRTEVRKMLKTDATDQQLDTAWNAMLGTLPAERIRLLEALAKKHRIFLLSNTNNIHLQFLNGIVKEASGHDDLSPLFEKAYYSHLLRMRKPDHEIFLHVLTENELNASETLFLDDNADNLRGARETGIQTAHVVQPDMIFSLLA